MKQVEVEDCCELGVKGSCATCDYIIYCNGKWRRRKVEAPVQELS